MMTTSELILREWPYLALALSCVLTAYLLLIIGGRPASNELWNDPLVVFGLELPIYMFHQFEEHGIDLFGNRYGFQASLCSSLGYKTVSSCPATELFIFAVNPGSVWISGALAWLFARDKAL